MNASTNHLIATALAHADEHQQAEVLNVFVDTLRVLCAHGGGLETSAGTQGHYIAKHLRRETAEFFRELVGSYDYAREDVTQELSELRAERDALIEQRSKRNQGATLLEG